METISRYTVLSSLAVIVADTLDKYGLDGPALINSVGIDYQEACDPDTRIPYDQAHKMWEMAAEKSGDPCFGIEVAKHFNPALLHGLGFSWMASSSLKDAFNRVIRFQKLINTGSNFQARVAGDQLMVTVELAIPGYQYPPACALSLLAGIVRLCRMTVGGKVDPSMVTFTQHEPLESKCITDFFASPVAFDGASNSMSFNRTTIEQSLPGSNPKLARINDQIIIDYLGRYDQQSLLARAQSKIIEKLPSGRPSQAEVARSLNMSLRNFQRKLKQEGTSFRELVDTIRKDLAIEFISDQQRSIGAISYNLGFTEPANFTRSFKAWTGMSPKQYRQSGQSRDKSN